MNKSISKQEAITLLQTHLDDRISIKVSHAGVTFACATGVLTGTDVSDHTVTIEIDRVGIRVYANAYQITSDGVDGRERLQFIDTHTLIICDIAVLSPKLRTDVIT